MEFEYYNPTKVFFEKIDITKIISEISRYGSSILVVSGNRFARENSFFSELISTMKERKLEIYELSNVSSNPDIEDVKRGVNICKIKKIEFVLAVGGGSIIDCAKAIGVGYFIDENLWVDFKKRMNYNLSLPVGTILTIFGSGTEFNHRAVISNNNEREKIGIFGEVMFPKFSFLDPMLTMTVSKDNFFSSIADSFIHILEYYFNDTLDTRLQNRISETLMKNIVETAINLSGENFFSLEFRENLMWCSSLALSGFVNAGSIYDGFCHNISHVLTAEYNFMHGQVLAILVPVWLESITTKDNFWKFKEYANNVWGFDSDDKEEIVNQAIKQTQNFFLNLKMPQKLSEISPKRIDLELVISKSFQGEFLGNYSQINKSSAYEILKKIL